MNHVLFDHGALQLRIFHKWYQTGTELAATLSLRIGSHCKMKQQHVLTCHI